MAEDAKVNMLIYVHNHGQASASFERASSYSVNVSTLNGEIIGGGPDFSDALFIPTDLLLQQNDDSGTSEAMMQNVSTEVITDLQTQMTEQPPVQSNFFQSNALSSELLAFQSSFSSPDTEQDFQMMSFWETSGNNNSGFLNSPVFGPSPVQQFTVVQSQNQSSNDQDQNTNEPSIENANKTDVNSEEQVDKEQISEPNAAAVIGGEDSGIITEDIGADGDGVLSTTGVLSISDVEDNESGFVADIIEGAYGIIIIDEDGNWDYEADGTQSVIQGLKEGDTLTDSIEITSLDGTTHTIEVTIEGTNDVAQIVGDSVGSITEDVGADGDGVLSTTGTLSISDSDSGEAGFVSGTTEGAYGSITIDENGNWRYEADGLQDSIQDLNDGNTLTDSIEITSLDGTTHTIDVTIDGADEDTALVGGAGNDLLITGEGDDVVDTGTGADKVQSGGGDDQINVSADAVWKGYGALNVETGNIVSLKGKNAFHDTYDGGEGVDTLNLTNQSDVLFLDNSFSPFQDGSTSARITNIEIINTGEGDDLIDLTSYDYSLDSIDIFGGVGNDTIWSSSGDDNLYGGQGDDYLYGGKGDDYLLGDQNSEGDTEFAGADQLYGADGDDTLDGGAGADSLYGQSGDDTLWFDAEDNVIDGGSGTDTLMVDDNFDFSVIDGIINNIEVVDLEGVSSLTIDSEFTNSVNGDGYIMKIEGDQAQDIVFEDAYVDEGVTTIDGRDYNTYTFNDTTFHIDTDVNITVPVV